MHRKMDILLTFPNVSLIMSLPVRSLPVVEQGAWLVTEVLHSPPAAYPLDPLDSCSY